MEVMNWKQEFLKWPAVVQEYLLSDRTARKKEGERTRIIWATDVYESHGKGYGAGEEMTLASLTLPGAPEIRPMAVRREEEKKERVKKRAEVFTPSWVCNLQNNLVDEAWFGKSDVFNHVTDPETHQWEPTVGPIPFRETGRKSWKHYVDRKVLEITCGEAPYLASRYDTVTGKAIPIEKRMGMLDRKLRAVSENVETEADWLTWARRAMEATYGYEYQGDSLLLARMNLMLTYLEYRRARWTSEPAVEELRAIARILSWNLWQMDGLKGFLPMGKLGDVPYTSTLFPEVEELHFLEPWEIESQVHDWRGQRTYRFNDLGNNDFGEFIERRGRTMKFDVVIGNPPYQEETAKKETENGQKTVRNIFQYFQLQAETVCRKDIILIYPGGAMDPSGWKRIERIWA